MMSLLSPPNTQSLQYKGILKRKANTSLKYERLQISSKPNKYFKVQKNAKKYHVCHYIQS